MLLVFFVSSCGKIRQAEIEELQEIRLKTLKGNKAVVEVTVLASNPSSHDIHIRQAEIEILREGYSFGTASLRQESVIEKRSRETAIILFDVEISDRMAIMSGRIRAILAGEDRTRLSFSGYVKAKVGIFSKRIPVSIEN
jgi:LEA14-like dessication related protein